jgi:hypothetical protein
MINVNNGQYVYAAIGYFEGRLVVIDSDSARPLKVPAQSILLTEQDRKSTKEFASRARELLKDETLLVDEMSSCGVKKRSVGLKFVDLSKLPERTEISIIRAWDLDMARVLKLIQKRPSR